MVSATVEAWPNGYRTTEGTEELCLQELGSLEKGHGSEEGPCGRTEYEGHI